MHIRLFRVVACAAALFILPACSGGGSVEKGDPANAIDKKTDDGSKIAYLVDQMNDVAGSPRKWPTFTVTGFKPADAKKFGRCQYTTVGEAAVSGNDATCKVKVSDEGKVLGEADWSFVKQGEAWKVKTAPLP